jgi:hypothetical protein
MNTDPQPCYFDIKLQFTPPPPERTSKLQKPSPLKRENPEAFQNMKFLNFFLLLLVIFALLHPDPDTESGSRYGSTDLIESGS